jgi:hypothetical protein
MRSFPTPPNLSLPGLIIVLGAILIACQTTGSFYAGKPAKPENIISIEDGQSASGQWQGRHITVRYRWQRSGDQLDLDGEVDFERRRSQLLRHFFLGVSFVDSEGIVLSSDNLLTTSGAGKSIVAVSKRLTLPPQTRAIAFYYKGEIFRPQMGTQGIVSAP